MRDDLGDRMKSYEAVETTPRFDVSLPVYARIDGRSFSNFTRGMQRPFDAAMTDAMQHTAAYLVEATHARLGYVQSDEISLIWLCPSPESSIFFDGKVQKMVSVLASMAAAKFGAETARLMPDRSSRLPHFDCRVFSLPSLDEGANAILWRALDARKNAVSMVAQAHFSHRSLQGKKQAEMLAMLADAGIEFSDQPDEFRHGSYFRRFTFELEMTAEELAPIPEAHRPTGPVMRSEVRRVTMPMPLWRVANRVAFVFDGADPVPLEPGSTGGGT